MIAETIRGTRSSNHASSQIVVAKQAARETQAYASMANSKIYAHWHLSGGNFHCYNAYGYRQGCRLAAPSTLPTPTDRSLRRDSDRLARQPKIAAARRPR